MPTFPAYARIARSGYSEQRESALLRTEMESGPPRQARIKTRVMITRPITIRLDTKAHYLAFIAWFSTELGEGAAWFDFPDPISGTAKPARFVGGGLEGTPGAGLSFWEIKTKIETWG